MEAASAEVHREVISEASAEAALAAAAPAVLGDQPACNKKTQSTSEDEKFILSSRPYFASFCINNVIFALLPPSHRPLLS